MQYNWSWLGWNDVSNKIPRLETKSIRELYANVKKIGQGSFGIVYYGQNNQGQELAIKCIMINRFVDDYKRKELIQQVKDEIDILKDLSCSQSQSSTSSRSSSSCQYVSQLV